ncbi:MAG: sulfurtransferase TusA family protein [Pseudomonadota bacterium]
MLFDEDLDAGGQRCPIPVLKARKRLKALAPGAVLRVYSDDPVAKLDMANLCREDGHNLLGTVERGEGWFFYLRKAS